MGEREQWIAYLTNEGPYGMDRREAELRVLDDDLWLLEPDHPAVE
jgi:hypothetical protein